MASPDNETEESPEKGPFDVNFLVSLALALLVWVGLRNDVVWTSFIGEADREALQIAFELRVNKTLPGSRPILFLNLDDSVWQGATTDGPSLAYAPRPVLTNLLEASFGEPGMPRPKVVIVDIDLFWRTPDEAAEQRIDTLLEKWGRDPGAPLLILQREVTEGDGRPGFPAAARASARDAAIENAPEQNIVWASAQLTGDEVMGARYFSHFLCVKTPDGVIASPTTALYAAVARKATTPREAIAIVQNTMEQPTSYCEGEPYTQFTLPIPGKEPLQFSGQQSLINYSLNAGSADEPGPQLPAADMFVIPAAYVESGMVAGLAANDGIVIIGSAAQAARDRHISAFGAMGGSLIIANIIRGVESGGEVRRMAWYIEASLLTLFVMAIVLAFWYCRKARDYLKPSEELTWFMRLLRAPIKLITNPVIIKILIGVGVFWMGAVASYILLDQGMWLGLAAPAYAAALNEAREDFEELMESLRDAENNNA
jgi:CHASE2 domain-containing protein